MSATSTRRVLRFSRAAFGILLLGAADLASAAPGGAIKAVAQSTLGRIVVLLTCLVFLPLIVWFVARRAMLVRRTRLALSALGRRAPHFAWLPLKERLTEVFGWVHSAWDQGKMDLARDYMTEWYARNQQLQLDKWERDGLRNITSDVRIKRMTPLYMSHGSGEQDRLVVEIEAEMRDYLVEKATDRIAQGDKALGIQTSVWSFVYENGRWLLSNIEPEDTAFEYLQEAGRALAAQAQHSA